MRGRNMRIALGLAGLIGLAGCSQSAREPGDFAIEDAWARAAAEDAPVSAGYARIENRGGDDRLVSASTPVAAEAQIHSVTMEDGVMRMRETEGGLSLPGGETVELRPGGYHIMLMQPNRALAEGEHIPITLTFERAAPVTVDFIIRPIGADR
ncbi:copper chaperone PCu(A)C [Parasphingopyxis marina]|uniref:Copper chaperone PCu(A)C n=1 Tax=Parasphingopyxis marina TaxID=2761622 RepID=A0A842HXH1_9SPHN|nr:copper chaperone PCu(A)C [Parasphingopyxis marina]MBC2776640.1 copper chaperone PCu(A)C [Parasphingopyxis marina]